MKDGDGGFNGPMLLKVELLKQFQQLHKLGEKNY
jgi:hypothetical protein